MIDYFTKMDYMPIRRELCCQSNSVVMQSAMHKVT